MPDIRLRLSDRVLVDGTARLALLPEGKRLDARLLDLSASGMGVGAAAAPAAGRRCSFAIELGGATLEGTGVVVWSRGRRPDREDAPNVGIRFEPDARSAVAISEWIERHRPARPTPAAATEEESAGGEPESPAAVVVVRPASLVGAPPEDGDVETPARPARRPLLAAGGAVAVVAVIALGIQLGSRDPSDGARVEAPAEADLAPVAGGGAALAGGERSDAAGPPPPSLGPDPGSGEERRAGSPAEVPAAADAAAAPPARAAPAAPAAPEPGSAADLAREEPVAATEPGAGPAPAAAPATSAAPEAERARRVLALTPSVAAGETIVEIRGDAAWRETDVFAALIGIDPPRYLLRLAGIERLFRPTVTEVGEPLLERIRTGLHDTPRGRELHVVLDLPTRAVEPVWEIEGDVLVVRLRPRPPG